jgi:elongation factor 1 alpha-like protein
MSAFFNEENGIAEEGDCNITSFKQDISVGDSEKQKWPDLSELDEVRLRSCLEEIRSVIGDAVPEQILIDSVMKNEFDFNKALDDVLSSAASATGKPAAGKCLLHYEKMNVGPQKWW